MNPISNFVVTHKVPLLTAGGIALGIGGTAWSIYNSINNGEEIKEHLEQLNNFREAHERGETVIYNLESKENQCIPYTDEMYKDDRKAMVKVIAKWIFKNYAGPCAMLCGSSACFLTAIGMQAKDIAAITAGFNTLTGIYEQYRAKVADKIGEDEERNLHLGLTEKTITEKVVDEKTGKVKEVKKKIFVKEESEYGDDMYVFYFDESSNYYPDSPDLNQYFLRAQQTAANMQMKTKGWIFLNEVLEPLGFPPTKFGQYVGWTKDGAKNGTGDGHIDFRAVPITREVNGKKIETYMLDFNVDGVITNTKWFDYKKLK